MQLGELVAGLGISGPSGRDASVRICDLTEDSRTVVPGSLFVARAGLKADGRAFVLDAVRAGAVAVLTDDGALAGSVGIPVVVASDVALATARVAERFYGGPSGRVAIAAVTGTNGKTTTSYLIWQMLNSAGLRCGLMGTVEIDDGVCVAPATMTTVPSIELSRSLAVMSEAGCVAAAIEASSHALDQKRVDGVKIGVGVFTNLTGDHLDYHKTMERYAEAKARLFELVSPDGWAVVNSDDAWSEKIVAKWRGNLLRCTVREEAGKDVCRARVASVSMAGMDLVLEGPWGTASARVPLMGLHNVMTTLQAVAAGWCLARGIDDKGLGLAAIERGLSRVHAPPGRLEPVSAAAHGARAKSVRSEPLPRVYVDYAHTDDALANVLRAVRGAMDASGEKGRLWVVFGAGGDKDRTKRPRMGRVATELADAVVVTSDNPRSEKPSAIVSEILSGVPSELMGKVSVQVEREAAIHYAVDHAAPEDVIVIAGKGHETEQVSAGPDGTLVKRHFDDREVAKAALASRAGRGARETVGKS